MSSLHNEIVIETIRDEVLAEDKQGTLENPNGYEQWLTHTTRPRRNTRTISKRKV